VTPTYGAQRPGERRRQLHEAHILTDNNIFVPSAWHLPHDWTVSAGRYTVTLIPPEGPLLDD
jgi:hypothetical protein